MINGVLQAETTAFLSESFQPNDVIECQATPNDGYDSGDSVNSTVTVINSPPVLNSITIYVGDVNQDSFQPRTNDIINVALDASDVDGDIVNFTYDWYVDGVLEKSGLGDNLDGQLFFDKNQQIYVVVTPTDGQKAGLSLTSEIGNSWQYTI